MTQHTNTSIERLKRRRIELDSLSHYDGYAKFAALEKSIKLSLNEGFKHQKQAMISL